MSSFLSLQNINKTFGRQKILQDVSFAIEAGELVCILGPSGCGKTTLFRILLGLEKADCGKLFLRDQDISALPVQDRGFGVVFQSYALFPTMTSRENIGYGLGHRDFRGYRPTRTERDRRVSELTSLVGLEDCADKYPPQLSGGQQQRVALARALASRPQVLLLDEPLSALDAKIRKQLRTELKRIHRAESMTTLMVTHDQEEAMVLADRLIVLNQGHVEQIGTPQEIYSRPASEFVARFIGEMNFVPDLVSYSGVGTSTRERIGSRMMAIRPELIKISTSDGRVDSLLRGEIRSLEYYGSHYHAQVGVRGEREFVVLAQVPRSEVEREGFCVGREVVVKLPVECATSAETLDV